MAKVTFVDSIGRTIYAEEVSRTDTVLTVKNPAVINVQVAQNGSLSVSLLPLFLKELLSVSSQSAGTTWNYNLGQITEGALEVDARLDQQYASVFAATQAAPVGDPSVIKLFDE